MSRRGNTERHLHAFAVRWLSSGGTHLERKALGHGTSNVQEGDLGPVEHRSHGSVVVFMSLDEGDVLVRACTAVIERVQLGVLCLELGG